jgi:hypothetical protein
MKTTINRDPNGSWTRSIESRRETEYAPGALHSSFGIALLWYKPERRLSVSLWVPIRSWNVLLWGPRTLSWQR